MPWSTLQVLAEDKEIFTSLYDDLSIDRMSSDCVTIYLLKKALAQAKNANTHVAPLRGCCLSAFYQP
jgi:hypothetical protein